MPVSLQWLRSAASQWLGPGGFCQVVLLNSSTEVHPSQPEYLHLSIVHHLQAWQHLRSIWTVTVWYTIMGVSSFIQAARRRPGGSGFTESTWSSTTRSPGPLRLAAWQMITGMIHWRQVKLACQWGTSSCQWIFIPWLASGWLGARARPPESRYY